MKSIKEKQPSVVIASEHCQTSSKQKTFPSIKPKETDVTKIRQCSKDFPRERAIDYNKKIMWRDNCVVK